MSTILKALKQLEDENRQGAEQSLDEQIAAAPTPKPARSRNWVVLIVGGLVSLYCLLWLIGWMSNFPMWALDPEPIAAAAPEQPTPSRERVARPAAAIASVPVPTRPSQDGRQSLPLAPSQVEVVQQIKPTPKAPVESAAGAPADPPRVAVVRVEDLIDPKVPRATETNARLNAKPNAKPKAKPKAKPEATQTAGASTDWPDATRKPRISAAARSSARRPAAESKAPTAPVAIAKPTTRPALPKRPGAKPSGSDQPIARQSASAKATATRPATRPAATSPPITPLAAASPAAQGSAKQSVASAQPPTGIAEERDHKVVLRAVIPELTVRSTIWHPQSDRRVAVIEMAGGEVLELNEGDAIGPLVVESIKLRGVYFNHDGVSVLHAVGR